MPTSAAMANNFPLRRCWATRFLWPMVRGQVAAQVRDGHVSIRMGLLGRVEIDVARIASLSRMHWPWWGGLGARLGRKMVAYTSAWGPAAVIELVEPIDARAPLKWKATRVVIGVEDVDGFLDAIAAERASRATSPASR